MTNVSKPVSGATSPSVPAEAGDGVTLPDRALERDRHALEQIVAQAATEAVVEAGEVVEPELNHGQLLLVALGVDQCDVQAVVEASAAREPGERIVVDEGANLLLHSGAGSGLVGEGFPQA